MTLKMGRPITAADSVKEAREEAIYLAAVADLVLDGEAQSRVKSASYLLDRLADQLEQAVRPEVQP